MTHMFRWILWLWLFVLSHIEAVLNRLEYHSRAVQQDHKLRLRLIERRERPRSCVLCGGPMGIDDRGPRGTEILRWSKCNRCLRYQHGSARSSDQG